MALIVPGGLAGAISGKVGNVVYARNRGGAYVRNFVKPINPQTVLQQATRNSFGTLSALWKTLGGATQAAFASAALSINNPNRVGLTSNPTGLNLFQSINLGRITAGLDLVSDPPPLPPVYDWNPGAFSVAAASSSTLTVDFDDSSSWCSLAQTGLLIYLSPNVSQSKTFYKGAYRFVDVILGNSGTPPTSPATITLPSTVDPNEGSKRRFFRAYVTMPDGSLGQVTTGFFDLAPAAINVDNLGLNPLKLSVNFTGPVSSMAGITATVTGQTGSPSTSWTMVTPSKWQVNINSIGSTGKTMGLSGTSALLLSPVTGLPITLT